MATFKPSNFGKDNTPVAMAKIGNVMLIIGTIGAAVVGLPLVLPVATIATIPAIVFTVGGWATAVGVVGKTISKMFGTKN